MGVVRERKSVSYADNEEPNLEDQDSPSSDTQSDDNDQQEEDVAALQPKVKRKKIKILDYDDLSLSKSNLGKRKTRRYLNKRLLESLPKNDDESDHLIEHYKGPFERLMEITMNPIDCINEFINMLEEQNESEQAVFQRKHGVEPYTRISQKVRRALKLRKNFPLAKHKDVENEMITFFKENPQDVFDKLPHNSFERFLLHAIAQYHDLHSINTLDGELIKVEVRNMKEVWCPVDCFLCDFALERKL